jgi:hypothetical protein
MRAPQSHIVLALLFAALVAGGCSKSSDSSQQNAAAPSASAGAPPSSSSAAPSASSASSGSSSAATVTWHGTYKSVAGTVTIPPSLKAGTWTNADTPTGLGEGALTLVVDPHGGRVTGSLEGPLGPASVAGFWADGKLTATIRRVDPSDEGFTGTLEAGPTGPTAPKPDELEGTMNGALGRANAVRTATFTLTSGGGAQGR